MAFKIGSNIVINDNREIMGFRNILHRGYVLAGYRSSLLHHNITRASYASDSTTVLGATTTHIANYLCGSSGTRYGIAWGVGSTGATGVGVADSGTNLFQYGTETCAAGGAQATARSYHEAVTYEGVAGYTTGGGTTGGAGTDKYTFSSDAVGTITACPENINTHGHAFTGNRLYGFWCSEGTTGRALTFSNEAWTTSSGHLDGDTYEQALACSTRENKAYHVGSWASGNKNSWKAAIEGTTITTTAIGEAPSRIHGSGSNLGNSESNCLMGNNYSRALGGYSSGTLGQHALSSKISHMTDSYVDTPALDIPNSGASLVTGLYGSSSGATVWR